MLTSYRYNFFPNKLKGGGNMIVDSTDRNEIDDARLARIHPEAYEAKTKAVRNYNPIKDLINFLKKLCTKKTR